MNEETPCRNCETGNYTFRHYCGTMVCDSCGHHQGLDNCYCGWKANRIPSDIGVVGMNWEAYAEYLLDFIADNCDDEKAMLPDPWHEERLEEASQALYELEYNL